MNWKDISPHFAPHEILSRDCLDHPHLVCEHALMMLNEVRDNYGDKLFVNYKGMTLRGVISSRENEIRVVEHDGARFSTHVQGHAFDVSPEVINVDNLLRLSRIASEVGFTWIKVYRSWVHMDSRNRIKI